MARSKDEEEEQRVKDKAARDSASNAGLSLVEKLRLACLARSGTPGILSLGRIFRRMDDNQSGSLEREEFVKGLKESGLIESDEQMALLFQETDLDSSGSVSYNEFLLKVRHPLNDLRSKLVEAAFKKLDVSGDGKVTLDDISRIYSVRQNPDFISGESFDFGAKRNKCVSFFC